MSLGFIATIRAIRNFLFSKANREFLLFLFFLVIAGLFWLMMALNETYEKEIKFYVRITNVPQNVVLTSGDIDSVRVNIKDKGFSLFSFIYSEDQIPVDIDFVKYAGSNGTGSVSAIDLQRLFEHRLPASAKITSVKTEKLSFYYNHGEKKKVPVRWRGHITPDPHYFLSKTIINPDSVTIYSSHAQLDSIDYVYTEDLNYSREYRQHSRYRHQHAGRQGATHIPFSCVSKNCDRHEELSCTISIRLLGCCRLRAVLAKQFGKMPYRSETHS